MLNIISKHLDTMINYLSKGYQNRVYPFLSVLWYLRVVLFSAVISYYLYSFVGQTLDIYAELALSRDNNKMLIVISVLSILLNSVIIWLVARSLMNRQMNRQNQEVQDVRRDIKRANPEVFVLFCIVYWGAIYVTYAALNWFNTVWVLTSIILFVVAETYLSNGLNQTVDSQANDGKPIKPLDVISKNRAGIWLPRVLGLLPLIGLSNGMLKARAILEDSSPEAQNLLFVGSAIIFLICIPCFLRVFTYRTGYSPKGKQSEAIKHKPQSWLSQRFKQGKSFIGGQFLSGNSSDSKGDGNQGLLSTQIENSLMMMTLFLFFIITLLLLPAGLSVSGVGLANAYFIFFGTSFLVILWNSKDRAYRNLLIFSNLAVISLLTVIYLWLVSTHRVTSLLVSITNFLGPLTILSFAIICLLFVASTVFYWGIRNKVPALTALLALVLISSFLNSNDNHRIRLIATGQNSFEQEAEAQNVNPSQPQRIETLESAFSAWLNQEERQKEIESFQKDGSGPYPIYMVSAQGGGIYAAYHAAMTLAQLQDLSPDFSKHVFALSSVSGGSLGTATFSSLMKAQGQGQLNGFDSFVEETDQILGRDLLSPLLAAGLFPGVLQRFIPWRINDWDRVRGLEYAFEEAWTRSSIADAENPLKESYYDQWDPAGEWPALIFNTTVVETGERLTIAPFSMSLPDTTPTAMVRDIRTCNANPENVGACKKDIDFRLSTAAILSARFPLVTPVGWFKNENKEKYRLADGGYFDNSGLITAIDVGQSLEQYLKDTERDDEVEVRYISLIGQADEATKGEVAADGLNETLSPIRALLNSRAALGKSIFGQAKYLLKGETKLRSIVLDAQNLPLGWYLSESSQDKIKRQITFPISDLKWPLPEVGHDDVKSRNKEVMTSIICELTVCEHKL